MLAIRGASSLARGLIDLLPAGETFAYVPRGGPMPMDADRYLFCQGLLQNKLPSQKTAEDRALSFRVNYYDIVYQCNAVIKANPKARICVIGSESGYAGSYDRTYAVAKSRLHHYVRTKKLRTPYQQLVCVAPGIISDAGMTLRRTDDLTARQKRHPKQRFLTSAEVASAIHFLLYVDKGYITNHVLRINGGEHLS